MQATVVRLAAPADATAVVALAAALWPDEPLREHRAHMRAVLGNKAPSTLPLVVLVAVHRSRIVGFVEVGLRSHADGCDGRRCVGFVEGWYVVPAWRGRAVGRALMAAAEEWAREQGCAEMASDTWADNEPSRRAHQALGFEVVDRCVHFRKSLGRPSRSGASPVAAAPRRPPSITGRTAARSPSRRRAP